MPRPSWIGVIAPHVLARLLIGSQAQILRSCRASDYQKLTALYPSRSFAMVEADFASNDRYGWEADVSGGGILPWRGVKSPLDRLISAPFLINRIRRELRTISQFIVSGSS